ncbi:MAG: cupin domain-containing protein [Planctomycetota bacterium]|jgi:predicted cupin superfamily sugar epimerase
MATAEEVIEALGLAPLPREGGWYLETWRGGHNRFIEPTVFSSRSAGTAIYYLLKAGEHSRLHRLASTEIYFHHAGSPLGMLILDDLSYPSGRQVTLGPDIGRGQIPQLVIPAGAVHGSRPMGAAGWTLVSTVMVPGFDSSDYSEPEINALILRYPRHKQEIEELA